MKPVEDVFSSDIFRRVVLPGIVLSSGFHPFISRSQPTITDLYGVGSTGLIVAEVIIFGLGVSSGIQWIYYVYEGFRLEFVTSLAGRLNRMRVERYQTQSHDIQGERDFDALSRTEQAKVTRIYEFLLDFPLALDKDGSARHYAERPTRLGNIIATYELYAESRYGIDGTYFWYHLLNLASDTSRKAFDDAYAFAESLVLGSFAGVIVAVLHIVALLGFAIGALDPSLIFFHVTLRPSTSAWLALFGLLVWWLFYQAALPAHRTAGAVFRATIDGVVPTFLELVRSLQVPLTEDAVKSVEAVNEYLRSLVRPEMTPAKRRIKRRRTR
jgi:hypothetical protein